MSDYNTHGGYYAPNLIHIGAGGTHEENPNGGVPFGVDMQGIPNLVEQGEDVYNDYVFSDRLKATKSELREFGLPEKYAGKTFAYIAEKLSDEAALRPNDAISANGMGAMLDRLMACQDAHKERLEATRMKRELSKLSPEELLELGAQLGQAQQAQSAGMPMQEEAQVPQDMQPSVSTMGQEQQVVPEGLGGGLPVMSAEGGLLTPYGYQFKLGSKSPSATGKGGGERIGSGTKTVYDKSNSNWFSRATLGAAMADAPAVTAASGWSRNPDGITSIDPNTPGVEELRKSLAVLAATAYVGTALAPSAAETASAYNYVASKFPNYLAALTNPRNKFYSPVVAALVANPTNKAVTAYTVSSLFTAGASGINALQRYIKGNVARGWADESDTDGVVAPDTFSVGTPESVAVPTAGAGEEYLGPELPEGFVKPQGGTGGRTKFNADVKRQQEALIAAGYNLGPSGADGIMGPYTRAAIQKYEQDVAGKAAAEKAAAASPTATTVTGGLSDKLKAEAEAIRNDLQKIDVSGTGTAAPAPVTGNSEQPPILPTGMRYAGAIGNGLLALYNGLQKPTQFNFGRIAPQYVTSPLSLQRQRFNPYDYNLLDAQLSAQQNATNSAISNAGLGAGVGNYLLASADNAGRIRGNTFWQTQMNNDQNRANTVQANNTATQAEAQAAMQADAMNAQMANRVGMYNNGLRMQEQLYNDQAESQKWAAVSAALDAGLTDLSNIGRENMTFNQVNRNSALLYGVDPKTGAGIYKAPDGTSYVLDAAGNNIPYTGDAVTPSANVPERLRIFHENLQKAKDILNTPTVLKTPGYQYPSLMRKCGGKINKKK